MKLIEIQALENGAHNNQTIDGVIPVPDGWAVIPDDMVCENFPFGKFETEVVDGLTYMKRNSWVPGEMPEPEPTPEPETPETEESVWDELDAAYTEGVNGAYDE